MSGFSELIKSFDKTRDYVRDFFIYGFKPRSEFGKKSARTYDDEKRRVESWLGDYLRYDNSACGKMVSISADVGHIYENPLYKAYYSKSFTDNDVRLHFLLLDVLYDHEPLSLREIVEKIDSDYGLYFEEQTVRNKLKEYSEEGLIVTEKRGKTAYFTLPTGDADELFERIPGLDDAVRFFSQCGEFSVIGNSILKTVGSLKNESFLIKHNYIVHTLEDGVILDLISAMEQKRTVSIRKFPPKSGCETVVVPLRINASTQTGRRFLIGYPVGANRFASFRLDYIRDVKLLETIGNYDEIYNDYLNNMTRCFGVSFGDRQRDGNVEPLKITIFADEERERFIINRLEREKRCGHIQRTGKNSFELTLDIFDPTEALPWIKSFIGRITKIEGGSEAARSVLYDDVKRLNDMYNTER